MVFRERSLAHGLTWVPSRPCRAPKRRRTCPESCPRREERQEGSSCPRAAITPSRRRVAAPRMSCALVCSWETEVVCFRNVLITGGEPIGVASGMNHRSRELDRMRVPPIKGIPSQSPYNSSVTPVSIHLAWSCVDFWSESHPTCVQLLALDCGAASLFFPLQNCCAISKPNVATGLSQ